MRLISPLPVQARATGRSDGKFPREKKDGAQIAIFARLVFRMKSRPSTLILHAPTTIEPVSVGFVAYDRRIPINDFRYFSASQEINLDWEDPWYSSFSSRSLRRWYSAPMSGFIYFESHDVRKEIILRPKDLQAWVDLGLAGADTIPAEMQPEILRSIGEFLRDHQRVEWDLWNERIQRVPGSAVDEAGPLPSFLESDSPILEWRNFLMRVTKL